MSRDLVAEDKSLVPLRVELWFARLERRRLLRILKEAGSLQYHVNSARKLERHAGERLGHDWQGEDASLAVPTPKEMQQLLVVEEKIRRLRHKRRLTEARSASVRGSRRLAQLRRSPLSRAASRAVQTAGLVVAGQQAAEILKPHVQRWAKPNSAKSVLRTPHGGERLWPPARLDIDSFSKALQGAMDLVLQAAALRALLRRLMPATTSMELRSTNVDLDDVAGVGPAKSEALEIIECLMAPSRFATMGARCPKGLLLTGPPGCGKTMLAKAIASTAAVPFIARSGSDFNRMFAGAGSSLVKDLFKAARLSAPAVVLIDELDYIGRRRGEERGGGLETDRSAALTQLLVEMDGFGSSEGIVVIGTTNRPDILDKALLRPGRFDRKVTVPLPDVRGRLHILKSHAKRLRIDAPAPLTEVSGASPSVVNFAEWAKRTAGFSGADLAGMVNEAAMAATREAARGVCERHMQAAYSKSLLGVPSGRRPSEEELALTAAHEAGHAIVNEAMRRSVGSGNSTGYRTVAHISIVPTEGVGGVTQFAEPEESKRLPQSKRVLLAHLAVAMGGRAAEEVMCGRDQATMGAREDFEQATRLATEMVRVGGLSRAIGPRSLHSDVPLSEETKRLMDGEIDNMLRSALDVARHAVYKNRKLFDAVRSMLLEKETLTAEEFQILVRREGVCAVKT